MKRSIEDYKHLFEDRVGICQYDGNCTELRAKNIAWEELRELYMKDNRITDKRCQEMKIFQNIMKSNRPDKIIK